MEFADFIDLEKLCPAQSQTLQYGGRHHPALWHMKAISSLVVKNIKKKIILKV